MTRLKRTQLTPFLLDFSKKQANSSKMFLWDIRDPTGQVSLPAVFCFLMLAVWLPAVNFWAFLSFWDLFHWTFTWTWSHSISQPAIDWFKERLKVRCLQWTYCITVYSSSVWRCMGTSGCLPSGVCDLVKSCCQPWFCQTLCKNPWGHQFWHMSQYFQVILGFPHYLS